MIRRIAALLLLLWLFGFALYAVTLPGPATPRAVDGVIVLTGGSGRLEHGIALVATHRARRLLVSGVDRRVTAAQLAIRTGTPLALFACCVDLGRDSVDTRSNALESAAWVRAHGYRSIRLVTTDWHMPRAHFELARLLSRAGVQVIPDAVPSEPGLRILFTEYNKYVLRRIAVVVGL